MGINGVTGGFSGGFNKLCPGTGNVAVVDRPESGTTFLHELMHVFGYNHLDCDSGKPCADECQVQPDGTVKLFCCCQGTCRHKEVVPLPSCLEAVLENKLDELCDCLAEISEIPEECKVCQNTTSIQQVNPSPKVPGCSGKETVEYKIIVCNDCKASENVEILLSFPANSQIITDSGPLTFDPSKSSNTTSVYAYSKIFAADECLEFTVSANVVSGGSIGGFTTHLWTWFKTDNPDYIRKNVRIDAFSDLISLNGNLLLSELVDNNTFAPQPNGCINQNGSARYIKLDGTLNIDIPYCFQNVFFLMEEGSQINVNGTELKLVQSEFVGCESMWQTIRVESGGKLDAVKTLISDAFIAISPQSNTQLDLSANQFINNQYGIEINNALVGVNTFDDNLFSAASLIAPLNGSKGIAGISISDVVGNIQFVGQGNTFTNMDNGFISGSSNFDLKGSRFLNFKGDNDFQIAGYGVLSVQSRGKIEENDFSSCQTAIRLEESPSSLISTNSIIGSENGIHSRRSDFVDILSNSISTTQHGVHSDDDFVLKVLNNSLIEVSGNEGEEAKSYAIRIEAPANTLAATANNSIVANNAKYGLAMRSGTYLTAYKNSVINNYKEGASGMLTVGVNNIDLDCNNVIGSGFYSRGIYDIDSKGIVECNKTMGAGTGINFSGGMIGVEFKGNAMMGNSNFGLSLRGGDITIGQQPHHGNVWLGVGASNNGRDVDASKFTIHTTDNGYLPSPPDPDFWFEVEPSDFWFECPDPNCGLNLNIPELPDFPEVEECEEFSELDQAIADGSFETTEVREGNLWNAQKGLLEKIKIPCIGDPPVFPEIEIFESENETSVLGQLVDVELGIKNLRVISNGNEQTMLAVQSNLETELENWKNLNAQLSNSNLTESEVQSLTDQRTILTTTIEDLQIQLNGVEETIQQEVANTANQLLDDNSIIITSSLPAENEKEVNAIYLQTLAIGISEFSEEQLSSLLDIASQCQQDGGDGVYRARSLYAYSYPDFIFNDEECEAIEFRNSKMNSTLEMVDFTLKPNPANTMVQLKFLNNFKFEGQVKIINLLGAITSEYEKGVDNDNLTLDVSNLKSGVYFIQVWNNGKVINSKKLSVVK